MPRVAINDIIRVGVEQVMQELADADPSFAAERVRQKAELAAWRAERDKLCGEVSHAQIPFVVALINHPDVQREDVQAAAAALIKASDWLFEQDAPGDLILTLLRTTRAALRLEV